MADDTIHPGATPRAASESPDPATLALDDYDALRAVEQGSTPDVVVREEVEDLDEASDDLEGNKTGS